MAKLCGIAIKQKKRGSMHTFDKARVSLSGGIENDFRGKPSGRQVTLMSAQAWREVNARLGLDLPWTTRRANLLVDGLDLESSVGMKVVIGNVELLVTQETDPCERMEEAAMGLFDALKDAWRGGVCCRVLREGEVRLGDEVKLVEGNT